MSTDKNIGFNKLFDEYLCEISSNEGSDAFLREHGLDPDRLVTEGLRKIKQIQMNIAAEGTEAQYQQMKSEVLQKAKAEVQKLLADASFSLQSFIKTQNINLSYKNFEEMTPDEVREFLERHFMLKFDNESKAKGKTN